MPMSTSRQAGSSPQQRLEGPPADPRAHDGSSATDGDSQAAAADAPALWRQFRRERARCWARVDSVAAGLFLCVIVAVRLQVGVHDTERDEFHSGTVLFLTVAVMLTSCDLSAHGHAWVSMLLILALKLAAATSPLFRQFSFMVLDKYPPGASRASLAAVVARLFLANHVALLVVLGTAMPQGIAADALAQLLFFLSLTYNTGHLCDTKYVQIAVRTSSRLSALADKRACVMAISSAQLWLGVALPMLLSVKRESSEALRFARRHGIPPSDPRLRRYAWLDRATSLREGGARLAAVLVGMWAVWGGVAWSYLGGVYE